MTRYCLRYCPRYCLCYCPCGRHQVTRGKWSIYLLLPRATALRYCPTLLPRATALRYYPALLPRATAPRYFPTVPAPGATVLTPPLAPVFGGFCEVTAETATNRNPTRPYQPTSALE